MNIWLHCWLLKNTVVVQKIQWQKFPFDTKMGHLFELKNNFKWDFIPYGLVLEFQGKKRRNMEFVNDAYRMFRSDDQRN